MKLIRTHYPYVLGTDLELERKDVDHLVRLFEKKPDLMTEILNGRSSVVRDRIFENIPVVIKFYRRGGLIRHVMRDAYLRSGQVRSAAEYAILQKARALGISCPEPLVWAMRGGLFYKAFLVTREIENPQSLVDLCEDNSGRCSDALHKTAAQVSLLIRNRIHHVDLHPGNVLVDNHGNVHIIDFDKAHVSPLNAEKLTHAILKRWKRAVTKYNLPEMMSDVFERELRLS